MKNIIANKEQIGVRVKIADSAYINCNELVIGNDVIIDERVKIICKNGKVIIGDQTLIGNDVAIMLKSFEIGEYCKVHNHSLLNGKQSIKIGNNCWFGQNCVLNGESDLIIGNNVGIGTYSSIWTHGYFGQLVDGCRMYSLKPTIIEDDAWLVGSYNTVFPGVTIGKQAVLMGTSVVTRSLEAGKIYSGNPAKDITDKIGKPYMPITFEQQVLVIKEHIETHLKQANINFTLSENKIRIQDYGEVLFALNNSESEKLMIESVCFFKEVTDWSKINLLSKFCLKSKYYQKNYSEIEILIKKILNPVVARFIPKQQ
jgi:acetyltransferase-like isoleucine patch superfamily enzyme